MKSVHSLFRRCMSAVLLAAICLTLLPVYAFAASDQSPDVIIADAHAEAPAPGGKLYRYYFGGTTKAADGTLMTAFYRNIQHAPFGLYDSFGLIMKVTGSADAKTWSEPEVFIDQSIMEDYGWGMRRDRKGTPYDASDDVLYYGYKYDTYYYANPDEEPTDGKLYYYYDSQGQQIWVTEESIVDTAGYDFEIRDPNFQTLSDGTIVFTFFSRIANGAIVNGRAHTAYDDGLYTDGRAYIMHSFDNGRTWSEPTVIPSANLDEGYAKRGAMAEFSDGELLICLKGRSSQLADIGYYITTTANVRAKLDRDTGSWSFTEEIFNYNDATDNKGAFGVGSNEVAFGVTEVDGVETVYALLRYDGRVLESKDRGVTWEQIAIAASNLHQPNFANIEGTNLLYVVWSVPRDNYSRNVYGKVFDPKLGWDATETHLIYENTELDWETSGKYETGWRWDMADPSAVHLDDGRIMTTFYDTGLRVVAASLDTLDELYTLNPAFNTEISNSSYIAFYEDFEDNAVGLYPTDDVLVNNTNSSPRATVAAQSGGNVLQHYGGSGNNNVVVPIQEGDAITFDFRMPENDARISYQTFSMNIGNDGQQSIQLRSQNGKQSLGFVDAYGTPLEIRTNGVKKSELIYDVFKCGPSAPWYTIKLLMRGNSVHMKLWERGTAEPADFQYQMFSDAYFVGETELRLRVMGDVTSGNKPYDELDNIRVIREIAGADSGVAVLTEDFEDNTVGKYPTNDVLGNPSVLPQVVDQSGNKLLQHVSNTGYINLEVPIQDGDLLSFEFRMPLHADSGSEYQTLNLNVGNGGLASIQLRQDATDDKALMRYVDNYGAHLGINYDGKVVKDIINDLFSAGTQAPWYNVKLLKKSNIVCLKLWEQGTAEPASYTYTFSNNLFVNADYINICYCARSFPAGTSTYAELDNIYVIRPATLQLDKTMATAALMSGSIKLNATLTPAVTDAQINWKTSDPSVATVDKNGRVTLLDYGTAVITASAGTCTATCTVNIPEISLNTNEIDVYSDAESVRLAVSYDPALSVTPVVTWTSADESVAKVSKNGLVTILGTGRTYITAATLYGTAVCVVNVEEKPIEARKVTLNKSVINAYPDTAPVQLTATIDPADADAEIVWTSANDAVATVDENGLVTIKGMGTTYITATTIYGYTTCPVVVVEKPIEARDVTMSQTVISANPGDADVQLNVSIDPADENAEVIWTSAEETVATVDETGLVTIVGIGTTYITATTVYGYAICPVVVTEKGSSSGGNIIYVPTDAEPGWKLKETLIEYIDGYPDGTFGPERIVTRGEMAQMLFNIIEFKNVTPEHSYTDIGGTWVDNPVGMLCAIGVLDDEGGKFNMNEPATRADFVEAMARILKVTGDTSLEGFTDTDGHALEGIFASFKAMGILDGYEDGSVQPEKGMTRAEMVTIINRAVGVKPESGASPWPDVPETHWACGHIRAATESRLK